MGEAAKLLPGGFFGRRAGFSAVPDPLSTSRVGFGPAALRILIFFTRGIDT